MDSRSISNTGRAHTVFVCYVLCALTLCAVLLLLQGLEDRDERSLHGITFDPKRRNWKARIHFAGKEHYIGR